MTEQRNTTKWARSLHDAGLIDDIEDGWSIPGEPVSGATIVVQGERVSDPQAAARKTRPAVPAALPGHGQEARTEDSEPSETPSITVGGRRISVAPTALSSARTQTAERILVDNPAGEDAPIAVTIARMKDLYDVGDYTGALATAERILEREPGNRDAERCSASCRETLMRMYEARIGSFDRVPVLAVPEQDVIWRNLDPTAGFVLSRVDGASTFEDIIDMAGIPRFEACRILEHLLEEGIIK